MIPAPFIVVLDANVRYPFTLRDTLLRAAAADFYQLRWTTEILNEMERNLLKNGVMSPAQAAHLRLEMETYFPEARVDDYEAFVDAMKNDEKDRHVAAAAVLAGSQVIVTSNLKDFPSGEDVIKFGGHDEGIRVSYIPNLDGIHAGYHTMGFRTPPAWRAHDAIRSAALGAQTGRQGAFPVKRAGSTSNAPALDNLTAMRQECRDMDEKLSEFHATQASHFQA